MLRLVILLALTQSYRRGNSHAADPLEYRFSPTWSADPEYTWTVAKSESRWKTYKDGAENMGLLFAGRAEFTWLVDIRVEGKAQEYWSIGTLINYDTAFTTCRAVQDIEEDLVDGLARVLFGQVYLLEYVERLWAGYGSQWQYGGYRFISSVKKHPKCNIQQNYYDGGIVTMTNPIYPAPPTIGLAQLAIDYHSGLLGEFDLSVMINQRRICYVASIGREFANIRDHLVQDYKVKYRVYWEPPELCLGYVRQMCPNRQVGTAGCESLGKDANAEGKELMCFKSRAKVGAVCDHDRGAPVVCDGDIFGLVIMGANKDYCNNLLALPFWVQKINVYETFFNPTINEEGKGKTRKRRRHRLRISIADSASTNYQYCLLIFSMTVLSSFASIKNR